MRTIRELLIPTTEKPSVIHIQLGAFFLAARQYDEEVTALMFDVPDAFARRTERWFAVHHADDEIPANENFVGCYSTSFTADKNTYYVHHVYEVGIA